MPRKPLLLILALLAMFTLVPPVLAQEGEGGQPSAFCGNENSQNPEVHPMAAAIAARFGGSESEIMDLFCNGDGETEGGGYAFGHIILSYTTAKATGEPSPRALLVRQRQGNGWGQLWKEQGLIGQAEDGVPPGFANRPANAGQPGGGRPEGAGKPDCPPEQAGGQGQGQGGGPPDCEVEPETTE